MDGGETDLFGNPVEPLPARSSARPPVNDMEVIERVLREASQDGFVLIGVHREQVHRRTTGDDVEPVSAELDAAVHQLIDAKWLEVGGTHQVRYGRLTGPGRSVLVPKKSRQKSTRWDALAKLPRESRKTA